MIYRIDETTSTNDEARDAKYRHGDIVWAERQTAGRGQRGHTWTSPEGENLTFSMVLEPRFLPVGEQFLLSEAVTLALTDTFAAYGIDTRIKWTNDIYIGDRKLVGILLETFLVRCLRRYAQLERGEKETLQHAYRERMYRLGEQHPYRLPDGTLFQAAIEGVLPSGELILRHADGTRHEYLFREIEFVIAGKQENAGPAEK